MAIVSVLAVQNVVVEDAGYVVALRLRHLPDRQPHLTPRIQFNDHEADAPSQQLAAEKCQHLQQPIAAPAVSPQHEALRCFQRQRLGEVRRHLQFAEDDVQHRRRVGPRQSTCHAVAEPLCAKKGPTERSIEPESHAGEEAVTYFEAHVARQNVRRRKRRPSHQRRGRQPRLGSGRHVNRGQRRRSHAALLAVTCPSLAWPAGASYAPQ